MARVTTSLALLLLLPACSAEVRDTSHAEDGSIEDGSNQDGSNEDGSPDDGDDGGGGTGGDPDQAADALAMCPAPPARPEGLREGSIPPGAPDAQQAAAMFQRASHEVGHLVSVLLAEPGDAANDLLGVDGDTVFADRDGEALRGTITRDPTSGRLCAAIRFGAWTGGHGGWGLSALDGTMLVLIDGGATTAVGTLGLVDSGALEGAPTAEVRVDHDGELLSGTVGEHDF